ncbi:MAG: hypothetical protein HY043_01350 [Verrucomicrobia bacterium]|nr:hypothetical protein [Verrucomicrobiota bacterium]
MNKAFDLVGGIGDTLQLLSLVALVVVGPFVWMWQLFAGGRFSQFAIVVAFWLLSLAVIGWEVRRKAITAVSLGVFLTWMVVLAFVFHGYLYL